jgi:hypothetical protein
MLVTQGLRKLKVELEPSEGIEPPSSTYEVAALPLSYLDITAGDLRLLANLRGLLQDNMALPLVSRQVFKQF